MSTIQRAFQKRFSGAPDLQSELQALDHVNLFPVPTGKQYDEFVHLANTLLEIKASDQGLTVAFASSVATEGASYVSYNVARQLAYVMNRRTLWIDANFKSPQRKLLAQSNTSFSEVLSDPENNEVLATEAQLQLLSGGHDLKSCAKYLATDEYPRLLDRLSTIFDFTIIDCPPILDTVETGLLGAAADGMVVVVERKRLKWEVIRSGLDMLAGKRVNVLGTVLNRRAYELPKVIYDRL